MTVTIRQITRDLATSYRYADVYDWMRQCGHAPSQLGSSDFHDWAVHHDGQHTWSNRLPREVYMQLPNDKDGDAPGGHGGILRYWDKTSAIVALQSALRKLGIIP